MSTLLSHCICPSFFTMKIYFLVVDDDGDDCVNKDQLEQAADMLYGLIHARYILTNAGLSTMVRICLLPAMTLSDGMFILFSKEICCSCLTPCIIWHPQFELPSSVFVFLSDFNNCLMREKGGKFDDNNLGQLNFTALIRLK